MVGKTTIHVNMNLIKYMYKHISRGDEMRSSFLNSIEKSLDTLHFLYRAAPVILGICFAIAALVCYILTLSIVEK